MPRLAAQQLRPAGVWPAHRLPRQASFRRVCMAFVLTAALASLQLPASANLLINGGFETSSPSGGWPSNYGYWGGDLCDFVTAEQGITPSEGARMLSFVATSNVPCHLVSCQVYQLVDLSPYTSPVREGVAVATATALFNRVVGDAETDTQFYLNLRACTGSVSNFYPTTYIASATGGIYCGADPGTWESVTAELALPAEADYLCVGVNAREDIHNDSSAPEFDGHYCDAVILTIEIEQWADVPDGTTVHSTWAQIKALMAEGR